MFFAKRNENGIQLKLGNLTILLRNVQFELISHEQDTSKQKWILYRTFAAKLKTWGCFLYNTCVKREILNFEFYQARGNIKSQ